jgi:glutamate/aspartate transport system substrate-binding protein
MVRRDDEGFRDAVNAALLNLYRSGEIVDIYNRWFITPVPPNGINMNMPISDELRDVFKNPVLPAE